MEKEGGNKMITENDQKLKIAVNKTINQASTDRKIAKVLKTIEKELQQAGVI